MKTKVPAKSRKNSLGDIHTEAAAKLFGVAEKDVTAEQRRRAKAAFYIKAYGGSPN